MTVIKRQWLVDHGYLRDVDGEAMVSSKGIALLSDVQESRLDDFLRSGQTVFPSELTRDMKRGANGLMAKYGTDDMTEILYQEAVRSDERQVR
jgi:hypothetical protein